MTLLRGLASRALRPSVTSSLKTARSLSSLPRLVPALPALAPTSAKALNCQRWSSIQQARTFVSTRKLFESQEAPSAKTYLASGQITGGRDLVDVTKVVVIGSGGLSIGQAGEFDYSGTVGPRIVFGNES